MDFAELRCEDVFMSDRPPQPPEGELIERARIRMGVSVRAIAKAAGLSDTRWGQLVKGYATPSAGNVVSVTAPAVTLARMARAVGVTRSELEGVGRLDAAKAFDSLGEERVQAESGTPSSDDLRKFRDDESLPDHLRRQAQAQLESIAAFVDSVRAERDNDERRSG